MSDIFGAGQAVSGVAGAAAQISSAQIAADAQRHGADVASQTQRDIYSQNQQLLNPYVQGGLGAYGTLNSLLGVGAPTNQNSQLAGIIGQSVTGNGIGTLSSESYGANGPSSYAPSNSMQSVLANLPGYQFTLGQGLKSVQNSAASRGLGTSGAALKGAANYATGLANSQYGTYAGQLQNSANTGMQAGSAIAGVGQSTGAGIAAAQIGAGNATAAGWNATGNAIQGGINAYQQNQTLSSILNNRATLGGSSGDGGYSGDGNGEFYGL